MRQVEKLLELGHEEEVDSFSRRGLQDWGNNTADSSLIGTNSTLIDSSLS